MLVLAGALLLALIVTGSVHHHRGALVFFVAFGWLTGLGLAQLYKIVPFLTWLSRFGATLGRAPAPRVQDMVNEKRAKPWFVLYFAATILATLALLAGWSDAARFLVMLMGLATLAIAGELVRARWLFDLPRALGMPIPVTGIPSTGRKESQDGP